VITNKNIDLQLANNPVKGHFENQEQGIWRRLRSWGIVDYPVQARRPGWECAMTREIHFERWRFNPATLELSNGARTVTLEPRVASLLEYFLANPGEMLSHDQLVEAVWQGRVVSDEAVRRAVSTLRQALPGDDAQHWIKTVPRKGYVSQFPTAQTVRHEPDTNDVVTAGAGNAAPQPPRSARRSVLLALVLVALAAGSVWWLRYQRLPESSAQPLAGAPYTIAVLPFTELGEHDPAVDFAEGLTEELRSMLSRFGAFRVTARSSSQQIRTGQALPAEVGEILGVRFLLEGSVRSDGEQLRISAALVETGTGFQRWADSYDGGPQNLFQVQEDIATSVARALQVVLVHRGDGDTLGHVPASAEAHLEYLEGRQQMTSYVVEDLDQAAQHFRRAIVLDPGYARAYAQLADVMLFRSSDLSWQTSKAAVRAAVARLIDKALELDPGLGEAYAQRSFLHDAGDTAAIEADLRRAIELNPSLSGAYENLAMLLHQTGRPAEAFSMIDQARALDPLWPRHHHMKAYLHLLVGQYQEARALELETLRLQPRHVWALMGLGRIEALQGNFAEGLRYMEQAFSLDRRSDLLRDKLAVAYLSVGESAVTRALSHEANTIADLFLAVFEEDYRGFLRGLDVQRFLAPARTGRGCSRPGAQARRHPIRPRRCTPEIRRRVGGSGQTQSDPVAVSVRRARAGAAADRRPARAPGAGRFPPLRSPHDAIDTRQSDRRRRAGRARHRAGRAGNPVF
jgi:TolB-like protein/DNA-binding winged helix-turn-helix (wHTH) protein